MKDPAIPDLEVRVLCGGTPRTEYSNDDSDADPSSSSVYIESVSGENFGLQCLFGPRFPYRSNSLLLQFLVDEHHFDTVLCGKEIREEYTASSVASMENGITVSRDFIFSAASLGMLRQIWV